jgi:hypothetical protein
VFVYCDQGIWVIDTVRDGEIYTFVLNGDLTKQQTDANIIATVAIGGNQKRMLSLEESGL